MSRLRRLRKTWKTFDPNDIDLAFAYVQQELTLSDPVGNSGFSQREHLESVEKQTGKTPDALKNLIELPKDLREVYIWFKRLSNRRQVGMGVNPISFSEMKAFFELQRIWPTPEELLLIETFDSITTSHYARKQQKQDAADKAKAAAGKSKQGKR